MLPPIDADVLARAEKATTWRSSAVQPHLQEIYRSIHVLQKALGMIRRTEEFDKLEENVVDGLIYGYDAARWIMRRKRDDLIEQLEERKAAARQINESCDPFLTSLRERFRDGYIYAIDDVLAHLAQTEEG